MMKIVIYNNDCSGTINCNNFEDQFILFKLTQPPREIVKAKLLLLKLIYFFAREVLLAKKLDIQELLRPPRIQLLKLIKWA